MSSKKSPESHVFKQICFWKVVLEFERRQVGISFRKLQIIPGWLLVTLFLVWKWSLQSFAGEPCNGNRHEAGIVVTLMLLFLGSYNGLDQKWQRESSKQNKIRTSAKGWVKLKRLLGTNIFGRYSTWLLKYISILAMSRHILTLR